MCKWGVAQLGVSILQLFSFVRGQGSLWKDQDTPVNPLPTKRVLCCYFAGDSKGGFQSLIQNHSSKSTTGNPLFTIWFLWSASGRNLLRYMFVCRTLGLEGGTSISPTLIPPESSSNPVLTHLHSSETGFIHPMWPCASHSLQGPCTVPGVDEFPASSGVALPGPTRFKQCVSQSSLLASDS